MGTVDFSGRLKMMEDLAKHIPGIERNPVELKPPKLLPKKRAPHHCQAIRVFGARDRPSDKLTQDHFFEKLTVPPDHPIFMSGKSMISEVTQEIGIPLIVYLEAPLAHPLVSPNRSDYVNRMITYLLIKLKSGFANLEHQDGLGTALVARLDHKPLSVGLLTTINAYIMMLMDTRYGNGAESDSRVQNTITPKDFAKFARKFIDDTKKSFDRSWNDVELY
ncbi:hypothetical protein BJV82DRAFT_665960 [Fennellomyces sp. T-0311]|nr:hypothetical protein BJV82DRAFT_665960 [Fennellomyces sp. T-0311]